MARQEPVSRTWACICAPTVFALLWTINKTEKTRKWLLIVLAGPVAGNIVILATTSAIPENLFYGMDSARLAGVLALLSGMVTLYVLPSIMAVYFMYKWTTEYNLENFGYKSQREWYDAGQPGPPTFPPPS